MSESEDKKKGQREKMFDPAFQKAFTEAINKENKIRALQHVEDISGFPRTARVDFGASYDSDESDKEEEIDESLKIVKDEMQTCQETSPDKNLNDKIFSENKEGSSSAKERKSGKISQQTHYVFRICTFCDFGWKYSCKHYLFCPHHGPFRRGSCGYGQSVREYLIDQIRRDAEKEKEEKSPKSKLSNNFYS